MSQIVKKAQEFASFHHGNINQVRKYTGEPYIVHPAAVAKIVSSVSHTDAMLAAAWLHDTVEDTPATLEMIKQEFGEEIASLVEMLTDISTSTDGNRAKRKAIDAAHTEKASSAAKTVKLADLIHNSESILKHDAQFARVYIKEKAQLLKVLNDGDQILFAQASEIVKNFSANYNP